VRRIIASLLLAAAGAGFVFRPLAEAGAAQRIATGILLGVAALAMLRKSPAAQVFARGVAWSLVLPLIVIELVAGGFIPSLGWSATAGAAMLALVFARPMLHTPEARRAFDPVAFRSTFLAIASMSIAVAIAMVQLGWSFASVGLASIALPAFALGIPVGLAGVGVARMRGWGVLLGITTSVAATIAAFFMRHDFGWAFIAPAMAPGAAMFGVLAAARLSPSRPKSPPTSAEPVRVRVAMAEESAIAESGSSDAEHLGSDRRITA